MKSAVCKWKSPQIYDPNDRFHVESLRFKVWNLKYPIFSSKSEAPPRLSRKKHYRLFQLQESQQVTRSPLLPFCVFVIRDWVLVSFCRASVRARYQCWKWFLLELYTDRNKRIYHHIFGYLTDCTFTTKGKKGSFIFLSPTPIGPRPGPMLTKFKKM